MARRFRFRLEPVLRYRKMVEEEKQRDFAEANRAVEEARLRLESMEDDRRDQQAALRDLYARQAAFSRVTDTYRYINALDLQLRKGAMALRQLESVREEKRRIYVEARRDRRALELLRDRRREAFEAEAAREEQATLDELAIQALRHARTEETD